MTFPEFETYLKHLEGIRSIHTIRAYKKTYRRVSEWLQSKGYKLADLTPDIINEMRDEMNEIGPTVWNQLMNSLVRPFREWADQGMFKYPILPRHYRKAPPAPPRPGLTPTHFEALLKRAWQEGVPWPQVITVMGRCGLRVQEICDLRAEGAIQESEYHHDTGTPPLDELWVVGKGNKSRRVPLPIDVKQMLLAWKQYRKTVRTDDNEPHMFVAYDHESWATKSCDRGTHTHLPRPAKPLKPYMIWRRVNHWAKEMGVDIEPHDLRRYFSTRALFHNVPYSLVQYWLGHADVKTTTRYFTPSGAEIAAVAHLLAADIPVVELEKECRDQWEADDSASGDTPMNRTPAPVTSTPSSAPTA